MVSDAIERFVKLPPRPKVAFLGSPSEAAIVLERLLEHHMEPVVVLTNPPSRRTRGGSLSETPVGEIATQNGLDLIHDINLLPTVSFDLGVVVAYGHIIREPILALAPFVNLHFSLLPRWRGAAPVERAILALDEKIGVALMEIGPGLDEGAIFDVREIELGFADTAQGTRKKLAHLGAKMLVNSLEIGGQAFVNAQPQKGKVTYAAKLTKLDRQIDFGLSARQVDALVRVGGAWTTIGTKRIHVTKTKVSEPTEQDSSLLELKVGSLSGSLVKCGEGYLELCMVQPEGKTSMPAKDWLNGLHISQDEMIFGSR